MAWVERNKPGYVVNGSQYESYSVISAITNNNLELVVIRTRTSNQTVFSKLIYQLGARLHVKYKEEYKKFILIADEARYHRTKKVKNTIKQNELMIIQTVAYSPEFSSVELLINWVKSKIRKSLRTGKYNKFIFIV